MDVSADQLLGVRNGKTPTAKREQKDPQLRRLWKKFQQVARLPDKDQRAIRLLTSLARAS